jgi:hypothetical protein
MPHSLCVAKARFYHTTDENAGERMTTGRSFSIAYGNDYRLNMKCREK